MLKNYLYSSLLVFNFPWIYYIVIWTASNVPYPANCSSNKGKLYKTNFTEADFPDLLPPREVKVEDTTENSITLSWSPPTYTVPQKLRLVAYSLVFTPLNFGSAKERVWDLPPTATRKTATNLVKGTKYVVIISSKYEGMRTVSAPKFTVSTDWPEVDLPARDDTYITKSDCNCSDVGSVAVTNKAEGICECACNSGYAGNWCEMCASNYFRVGKDCKACLCTNSTSSGSCIADKFGNINCTSCLPGHRGNMCTQCTAGYQWSDDHCIPFNCLLCSQNRDAPGCQGCSFLEEQLPHKSLSDRTIADGTVPLIAVIVTLSVLLLVAGVATCYRYWTQKRDQPRLPFWSIELQDERTNLHTHCQYQHLDAATNKVISTATEEGEGGCLKPTSSTRTYDAINV